MTPRPAPRTPRSRTRSPRPPRRASRRLLAGTLAAGLAAGSGALALSPRSADAPVVASVVASQSTRLTRVTPVLVPVTDTHRAPRASRGAARTALPLPTRLVTRTVATGATFSGRASWYGGSFQGRRTANGERFDTEDLTAASRTLPFGTRLRVCRVSRCVVVRVNDRGPYVDGRVLDLSRAAARALGYSGVASVTATPVATRQVAVVDQAAVAAQRAAAHRRAVVARVRAARAAAARARAAAAAASPAPTPAAATSLEVTPNAWSAVLAGGALLAGCGGLRAPRRRTRP